MRTASVTTGVFVLSCISILVVAYAEVKPRTLECRRSNPYTTVLPKWYKKPLKGQMDQWVYDGISPFAPQAANVTGNDISIPLIGRGSEDPLKMDPFGAGMRLSTRFAYLGGKVCARLQIPEPTSGTIFGLYLIDVHPRGPERSHTKWREADLEWLGVKPDHVQTSVFEMGQEQPNAVYHNTTTLLDGATQEDPVDYCIEWDLTQPDNRYVRFTAKRDTDQDWVLLREWKPSSPEVAAYWNEPMRALISFWSNRSITHWSGQYDIPDKKVIWAHLQNVKFWPRGEAYCPKPDHDLQPTP